MTFDLTELGWDEAWARAFASHAAASVVPARVAVEFNHIFRVLTAGGERNAQQTGRIRHHAAGRHALAAVGDWVAVRLSSDGRSGTIDAILPRRSKFSRKAAGAVTEEQVVAANIDIAFIVMGLDDDFNLRRLERYLLLSHESGASPVVLLNKADLVADTGARVAEVRGVAGAAPVHAISAKARAGVTIIEQYLGRGRTGALLGSSGVGKSTLINVLMGADLLKTRAVRAQDSRGRHTTRHRQLIILPGRGLLIDTPGMRELQLWDVTGASRDTFDEIEALASDCHFTDCRHRDEPRCAVKAAIADGRIAADRYASYLKLQEELRELEGRRDVRAGIDEKRRARSIGKSLKQLYRHRGRE